MRAAIAPPFPPIRRITAADLAAAIEAWLRAARKTEVRVGQVERLAGGACHEGWAIDLAAGALAFAGERRFVVRRDGSGSMNPDALDRQTEFDLLRAAVAGGVAAPRAWLVTDNLLGRPALLMSRVDGEPMGAALTRAERYPEARGRLPDQLGAALAAIHRLDWRHPSLRRLPRPAPGQSPAEHFVERYTAHLDLLDEPQPAIELGLRWLRLNAPTTSDLALVHGDFRLGNVLVGADGARAVLDWEFAHVGDRHEDLAWSMLRYWRYGRDHLALGGVAPREPYLAAYERHSGHAVDAERLRYFEVAAAVAWAIGARLQCRRHLDGVETSVELAVLGRVAAEIEFDILNLLESRG